MWGEKENPQTIVCAEYQFWHKFVLSTDFAMEQTATVKLFFQEKRVKFCFPATVITQHQKSAAAGIVFGA